MGMQVETNPYPSNLSKYRIFLPSSSFPQNRRQQTNATRARGGRRRKGAHPTKHRQCPSYVRKDARADGADAHMNMLANPLCAYAIGFIGGCSTASNCL